MTVGFRVRNNTTGEVTVEITDRLARVIGQARFTTAPGSFVIPGSNTPFFYITSDAGDTRIPDLTLSGRTVSWPLLNSGFTNRGVVDFTIAYGEY